MSDELPKGWAEITLQNAGAWRSGGTPSRRRSEFFGKGIPWVKSGDLPDGPILKTQEEITKLGLENSAAKLMPAGTISMALYGATIGKLGLMIFPAATNQACANVVPDTRLVEPQFLFNYLLSERRNFVEQGQGGAQPNISQEIVRSHPFPLAPLAEQRRIVAKLEKLLGQVDACQQRLEKMPTLLKRFRQSILAAACSGRLTADWREENNRIEPVRNELMRCEDFRKGTIAAANKKAGIKKFRYKPAAQIDLGNMTTGIDELFDLPATWEWASLGQLTWSVSDGPHFSPKYVEKDKGVPFISGRNISYAGIDFSDAKFVSPADHEEFSKRARPLVGDVLLTKGGTTGIAMVVTETVKFSIWVHVALLKVVGELVTPFYLRDVLSASFVHVQSQSQTHGVGNQDLGLTRMIHMALPLPPLAEQQEIVRRVAGLFALADQLELRLAQARQQVDKLTPSLLARAFAGQLVPQNPADEPAEKLLERIDSSHE